MAIYNRDGMIEYKFCGMTLYYRPSSRGLLYHYSSGNIANQATARSLTGHIRFIMDIEYLDLLTKIRLMYVMDRLQRTYDWNFHYDTHLLTILDKEADKYIQNLLNE